MIFSERVLPLVSCIIISRSIKVLHVLIFLALKFEKKLSGFFCPLSNPVGSSDFPLDFTGKYRIKRIKIGIYAINNFFDIWAYILIQVTIRIGGDGHLDQSEAYDILNRNLYEKTMCYYVA